MIKPLPKDEFHDIYMSYHQQVRAILYRLCGQQHLDDLVQATFIKIWRNYPKFRRKSKYFLD